MTIFAVLFCTYAYYRGLRPELYLASQETLSRSCGALNTLLLLTSSWFVASGVHKARSSAASRAGAWFASAWACGAAFAAVKAFEYHHLIKAGLTPASNEFYGFYFILTGLHLLHVLIGMIVLFFLWRATRVKVDRDGIRFVESGATYWHMVDLLWVVLFPLLYLVRGVGA